MIHNKKKPVSAESEEYLDDAEFNLNKNTLDIHFINPYTKERRVDSLALPLDNFLKDAKVVMNPAGYPPGRYIEFEFIDERINNIYIPTTDIGRLYDAGDGIIIDINEIKVDIAYLLRQLQDGILLPEIMFDWDTGDLCVDWTPSDLEERYGNPVQGMRINGATIPRTTSNLREKNYTIIRTEQISRRIGAEIVAIRVIRATDFDIVFENKGCGSRNLITSRDSGVMNIFTNGNQITTVPMGTWYNIADMQSSAPQCYSNILADGFFNALGGEIEIRTLEMVNENILLYNTYGICNTGATTPGKVAVIQDFQLSPGARASIVFNSTNTAQNPTLNVNNTGAYPIRCYNSAIEPGMINSSQIAEFIYDGTNWILLNPPNIPHINDIITTTSAANPNTRPGWGHTAWTQFGAGRTLVGVNTADGNFNTVNRVGGASTHTLSQAEMPVHTHSQNAHAHAQNAHSHGVSVDWGGAGGTSSSTHSHMIRYTNDAQGGGGRSRVWFQGELIGGGSPLILPESHSHTTSAHGHSGSCVGTTSSEQGATASNNNAGSGGTHNNLQPYVTVYFWQRTG
jgi:microcystin-dependent protein